MFEDLEKIFSDAKDKISSCKDINVLLHDVKSSIFGKNSELTNMFSKLKDLADEQKKQLGLEINEVKNKIEDFLKEKRVELEKFALEEKLNSDKLDGSLPYRQTPSGSMHIITKTEAELVNIFTKYGFRFVEGLEIEEDFYNFTSLNVKKNHPARQMQDTFYLNGKNKEDDNFLLRTHTTCVDMRAVIEQNLQPPISLISCGKTFRCDSDRTHSPMFNQFEGLMIDKELSLASLKFFLMTMLKEFFETDDVCLRIRPSYFPFTEPSIEVDVGFSIVNGQLKIGGSEKWLEVLGAGMLHPNVLKYMNIDSEQYTAIAFGCGVERFAMLKYGANDIRSFTANRDEWLKHYSFGSYEF